MGASSGPRITKVGSGEAVEASFPDEDVPTWLRGDGVVSIAWGLFVSAYLLWPLVACWLVWLFWRVTLVKGGALLGVLLYLPTFVDGSERRLGRPMHALRRSAAWRSTLLPLRAAAAAAAAALAAEQHPGAMLAAQTVLEVCDCVLQAADAAAAACADAEPSGAVTGDAAQPKPAATGMRRGFLR